MFALDGQTFNIKNLLVNFSREFKTKDTSGQSSSTDDSEQGDKAAVLEVTGVITFRDLAQLTLLESMSSGKDEAGDRMVYRIVNDMANAFKIRQVKFSGNFTATEQESIMAWRVAFRLKEHNSVSEQKEQHQKEETKPEQRENTRLKQSLEENRNATQ